MQHISQYDIHGYTTYHYDILPSTADMAKSDIFEGMNRYIIIADMQQAGRGRLGNIWHSATGNLFCNIVTPLSMPLYRWSEVSLVIALALSDVIQNVIDTSASVYLKWPNDILVNGAKIAGILLETIPMDTPKLSVGMGVNILSSPIVKSYKTCYLQSFGCVHTVSDILPMIVERYEQWLTTWQTQGIQFIVSSWMARAWGVGYDIRVRTPQQEMHGVFVGVSESGQLLLQTEKGQISLNAGEVVFG